MVYILSGNIFVLKNFIYIEHFVLDHRKLQKHRSMNKKSVQEKLDETLKKCER